MMSGRSGRSGRGHGGGGLFLLGVLLCILSSSRVRGRRKRRRRGGRNISGLLRRMSRGRLKLRENVLQLLLRRLLVGLRLDEMLQERG